MKRSTGMDQEGWGLRKQKSVEDGKIATAGKSGREPRKCSPEHHRVGKERLQKGSQDR